MRQLSSAFVEAHGCVTIPLRFFQPGESGAHVRGYFIEQARVEEENRTRSENSTSNKAQYPHTPILFLNHPVVNGTMVMFEA
jgi:hypothetical protein